APTAPRADATPEPTPPGQPAGMGAGARRGETPPPPAAAGAPHPWLATLRAALAGAMACLLLTAGGLLVLHPAPLLSLLGGASWSCVAFFTSTNPILMDLIIGSIATTFGAIRGLHHAAEHPNDKMSYGTIAEKAMHDLGSFRDPRRSFDHKIENLV